MVNVQSYRANCPPGMLGYDPDVTLEMEGWEFSYNGITGDMDWYNPQGYCLHTGNWDDVPNHVQAAIRKRWSEIMKEND